MLVQSTIGCGADVAADTIVDRIIAKSSIEIAVLFMITTHMNLDRPIIVVSPPIMDEIPVMADRHISKFNIGSMKPATEIMPYIFVSEVRVATRLCGFICDMQL